MTFEEFLDEWKNEAPYITVKTSGSTGQPKTIKLNKEFVRASARRTNSYFSISERSRLHSCVAADYIGGKMMAVRSELVDCRFTWETPSNRPLSSLGKEEEIDLLAVVPSQMLHIVNNIDTLPELKAIIIGGAPLHPKLKRRIIESGLNAFETYGMTETASHIALRRVAADEEWFKPLQGIGVSLDERGCLAIYFESGESIVTNDIAQLSPDGGFRIMGRYDNVIITGGKKVNPEDLELRIAPFIEGNFIITSSPDEKWGERIVLRIEGRPEDASSIIRKLRQIVMPYELPKDVEWVERLPRTPNGKLLRR